MCILRLENLFLFFFLCTFASHSLVKNSILLEIVCFHQHPIHTWTLDARATNNILQHSPHHKLINLRIARDQCKENQCISITWSSLPLGSARSGSIEINIYIRAQRCMHTAAAAESVVLWYVCLWWRVADIKEIKVFSYIHFVGNLPLPWTRFGSVSDSPTKHCIYIVPFRVLFFGYF